MKYFTYLRRKIGRSIASDIIEEEKGNCYRRIKEIEKESKKEMEEYKHRIDEYVDHFMRCKLERDYDFPTKCRVMIEYDAKAFQMINYDVFDPRDSQTRDFMAREISYRVQREVASTKLIPPANFPHRKHPFTNRLSEDGVASDGKNYNSAIVPSNACA